VVRHQSGNAVRPSGIPDELCTVEGMKPTGGGRVVVPDVMQPRSADQHRTLISPEQLRYFCSSRRCRLDVPPALARGWDQPPSEIARLIAGWASGRAAEADPRRPVRTCIRKPFHPRQSAFLK
jgi:hypothetical protein